MDTSQSHTRSCSKTMAINTFWFYKNLHYPLHSVCSSSQKFSVGLRSGLPAEHTSNLPNHVFTDFALYSMARSCWNQFTPQVSVKGNLNATANKKTFVCFYFYCNSLGRNRVMARCPQTFGYIIYLHVRIIKPSQESTNLMIHTFRIENHYYVNPDKPANFKTKHSDGCKNSL